MSKTPPARIDAVTAAEKGRSFEGSLPIAGMARLGEMLLERSGDVAFRLHFGREGGAATVRGRVEAELTLECQCCLSALKFPVDHEFSLGIVHTLSQVLDLPESLEPLILGEEGTVSIADLIEDELILAVPHVPQHSVCEVHEAALAGEGRPPPLRPNAFADLPSLIEVTKD